MSFLPTNSYVRATKYYLIQYNDKYIRILKNKSQLEKGWELTKKAESLETLKNFVKSLLSDNTTDNEEIQRISLARSKRNIRNLALSNNFEYFGTITVNGYFCNRYELTDCQSKLKKIFRYLHDINHEFKYLVITEKHKDGAFHFHGLFSGLDLYCNSHNYFSNSQLDKIGYNSFSPIKDYNKCCNYITKYITKDCIRNSHNQIYIRSKGLSFAPSVEIEPLELENNWKFENDFCCIYDINLDNINDLDKQILISLILK